MGVSFSNLQTAMITASNDDKELQYEVDDTTETVLKPGPLVDVVVEAHAGPNKDLEGRKPLAYLIPVVEYLLTDRNKCRFLRTMPIESTDALAEP